MSEDAEAAKHHTARDLAEASLRAARQGDQDEADRLMDQAVRTDPEAAANVLAENEPDRPARHTSATPASDRSVAAEMRTVRPGTDAPDRAGISDNGSGADTQKR